MTAKRALTLAALVAICAAAYSHAREFRGIAIDDAFITFRYAENVATGQGFVFNPGEHVEGTSTFLFTIVLAAFRVVGVDPLHASRIVGVGSYLALVLLAYALVRTVVKKHHRVLGLGAAVLVAASTPLAFYSYTGMETVFFDALILLGAVLLIRDVTENRDGRAWPLAMGAVALTRPEGLGFFVLFLLLKLVHDVAARRAVVVPVVRAARALAWFAAVYLPLIAFRLLYFHEWLPNTVRAKSNFLHALGMVPRDQQMKMLFEGPAMHSIEEYLASLGVAAFLIAAGLLLKATRFATLVVLGIAVASAGIHILDEGDWMPYYRLLTPTMTPFFCAVALGLRGILFHAEQRTRTSHWVSSAVAITLFYFTTRRLWKGEWPIEPVEQYREWMGRTLATVRRDDDTMVTDMAGVVPFYSKIKTIDLLGLCDAYIARHGTPLGTMGKFDYDYVIRQRPTLYQFGFMDPAKIVYEHPRFREQGDEYWVVETPHFVRAAPRDKKILMVRKDRPGAEDLARALGGTLVDLGVELRKLGVTAL